jgi:hypothetical protein
MDKQVVDYFYEETSKAFGFLVSEHFFAAPQLQVEDKINFAFVTFMGKNLAIEFSLDEREGDITCILARVIGGKKATFRDAIDERDTNGVRVREYLSSLLRRRGVQERLFSPVGGLDLRARIKVTLADFAQILTKHSQEVLQDTPGALT